MRCNSQTDGSKFFKKRNQLRVYRLHGEAGSVSTEHLPEAQKKLKEIISQFDPADVYNADEQGYFFVCTK